MYSTYKKTVEIKPVKWFCNKLNHNAPQINNPKEEKSVYKPLRFFYLLRDDIFASKDRTKFFDFIIPVIPVMDGSNAYDQFIKHLKDGGVFELFNNSFLREFSLYIDDMRILKNIYNEFMIYYNRLKIIKPSPDKMLAMIAYKNLFPSDFSDLQLRKGFVFALFDNKEMFKLQRKLEIEKQIEEVQRTIDDAKNEHLESLSEWDIIYQSKKNKLSHYQHDAIAQLEEESTIRKAAIDNRLNGRINIYEKRIIDLKLAITRVTNEPLKELITRENIDEVFSLSIENAIGKKSSFIDVRGNAYFDLLKYLLRNGYIDETYSDYMTYFYPNSLSQADKQFLLSVSNQTKLEYSYPLNEQDKVIERLNILSFDNPEILNFSLMFYLLENQTSYSVYIEAFYRQLQQTENFDYIQEVFIYSSEWKTDDKRLELFVNQLNSLWGEFLCSIINNVEFQEICRDRFILLSLYNTPDDSLEKVNIDNCLTEFISNKKDFLNITEPNINQLISRFQLLGVAFTEIDYEISDKDLFEAVYQNSLYKLVFTNISQMLINKYELDVSNDFRRKNYTLILSFPKSPLEKYVSANINEYLNEIFSNCNGEIADDEKAVIILLNNKDVTPDNKEKYINSLITVLENLTDITDETVWKLLIQHSLIKNSEKNVIEYFIHCNQKLPDDLVDFINSNSGQYDYSEIRSEYTDEIQSAFFNSILSCNEINNVHYREILTSLKRVYRKTGFSIEGIDTDKVLILIDTMIIGMHSDSLPFIREHYPDTVINYVEKGIVVYIEILNDELFDFDEMVAMLSVNISDAQKLELLRFTDKPVSIANHNYSDTVKAYILENNFDDSDLAILLKNYPNEESATKEMIKVITVRDAKTIFNANLPLSTELFESIFIDPKIDIDIKMSLFASALPLLNEEQCKRYISQFDSEGNYLSLFDGKRPKIQKNDISERVLSVFLENGWITKFEPDEKEVDFYRVIGRKNRSSIGHDVDFID